MLFIIVFKVVLAGCDVISRIFMRVVSAAESVWNIVLVDVATPRMRTIGNWLHRLLQANIWILVFYQLKFYENIYHRICIKSWITLAWHSSKLGIIIEIFGLDFTEFGGFLSMYQAANVSNVYWLRFNLIFGSGTFSSMSSWSSS